MVLSRVLPLWFNEGHKVLLFSQVTPLSETLQYVPSNQRPTNFAYYADSIHVESVGSDDEIFFVSLFASGRIHCRKQTSGHH